MTANELKHGYNPLTEIGGTYADMLMDTGVYRFDTGESVAFIEEEKEQAFLLLDGEITFSWNGKQIRVARSSLFDQKPTCLHVSKGMPVTIDALSASEILIQKTMNDRTFDPVFYPAEDIQDVVLCEGLMDNTARRILRDIFHYGNAPYSNMVMGEVLTFPGKWSSYPPHHHPQPEVYFHRFDKPQGFGISIIGDQPVMVVNNSISAIPGGLCHPQCAAPGYAMYYCWMIRHLENNPWTERIDDPAHTWLYDKNAQFWKEAHICE